MKKLVATNPDEVSVVDVPMPECAEDEVLVRAVRSLISPGSELKRVRKSVAHSTGTWPNHDLGYSLAGIIEEIGDRVTNLEVGQRVVTSGHHQQFVTAKASMDASFPAIPLPDQIGWDAAPFATWSRSCANWMRRAHIQHHEQVSVVGCGLVGLLMTMWAKLSNPRRLLAIDLVPARLELALKCGADDAIDPSSEDVLQRVRDLTGSGTDVTLHCVGGAAVRAFEDSQKMTRNGGRIILIGHHTDNCILLPYQLTGKDLLGASVGYSYDTGYFLDGLKFLLEGKLPVTDIISHKVPYTEAPEIYQMLIHRPQEAAAVEFDWEMTG